MVFKDLLIKFNSKKGKQVSGLFFSNIINLPIGIVTSFFLTRVLGEVAFGNYSFLTTVFNFAIIIFSFGFFQASSRAIVLIKDSKAISEYLGATLVYLVILYILMTVSLFIYAMYDNNVHEKQLGTMFYYVIPFGFVFLLTRYFETLLQADNRIKELSISRLYPKVGFLLVCLFLFFSSGSCSDCLLMIFLGFILTQLIVYAYILIRIKVSFDNLKGRMIEIWDLSKTFGLHIYLGSLFSLGVAQSTGVLISYFSKDNSEVGFYTLALSLASPLMMIPNTIATIYYKDFIEYKEIPKKILTYTFVITISTYFILLCVMPYVITKVYGSNFKSVISLFFIVGAGSLVYGLADFYNRYLGANGRGKELRNSAFVVGICLLVLNYLFVPNFKAYGAAYAYIGGGVSYLICMYYFYYKFVKGGTNLISHG